jgi:hypothetical protein
MARKWIVREGQRYVQFPGTGSRPTVWEVRSIQAGTAVMPHARLINVEDPLRKKTISCTTLANPTFYKLVAETPPEDRKAPV